MARQKMNRRKLLTFTVAGAGALAGCAGNPLFPESNGGKGTVFHVAPDGSNDDGGSEDAPLATIQEALKQAYPGDTIQLAPGEYREELRTIRSGESGNPITINGPPEAVWRAPEDAGLLLSIIHSHIHVTGITMTGLKDQSLAYEDRDAYASAITRISPVATHKHDRYEAVDYLEGIVFEPSRIGNTAASFIGITRLKDSSIGGFEVIGPAGMQYHPDVENAIISHVGEIIYIGTGPDDMYSNSHPYLWDELDRTRNVRIHHINNREGYHHSELVDIKVGCENITVEYCTDRNAGGQTDDVTAGAISPKSVDCTIRWNDIDDCPVAVEFDPYAPVDHIDAIDFAENNEIYGNYIHGYSEAAFVFQDAPGGTPKPEDQRVFCGNHVVGPNADEYAYATGGCNQDIPEGDGVGHNHDPVPETYPGATDGESDDITISAGENLTLEPSIVENPITVDDPIEVAVTVTNSGDSEEEIELELSAEGVAETITSERVTVSAGEEKRVKLVSDPPPSPGEGVLTLNGDRIGTIVIEESNEDE
jgi:hypothetical protein